METLIIVNKECIMDNIGNNEKIKRYKKDIKK